MIFQTIGADRLCPNCGFQFKQQSGVWVERPNPSPVLEFLSVLGKILLIMLAIGAAGVGLLFAGCAILMKMH